MAFLRDGRSAGTTKLGLLIDLDSHKLVTVETTYLRCSAVVGFGFSFMRGPHETVLVRWLTGCRLWIWPRCRLFAFASRSRDSGMVRAPCRKIGFMWVSTGESYNEAWVGYGLAGYSAAG